ncbi:unnamed protein product, partial [Mesorhabditis belari]|uniref:Galactokinase n=1 Tax=Mesorhabditis belari TaxID=2138241 RepID=A0AAF3EX87_9BILA
MEIEFEETYGVKPLYRIKCPGRVNLIGGSIDYNGYGVLPMAIDLNIELLVVPTTQSRIEFQNCQPDKYKPSSMPLPSQWNGASPPQWFDYLLCGWKGVLEAIQQPPRGMLILVKGTIPPSSGLSSSSALVCAAALATLVLHTGHGFTSMHNK